MLPGQHMVLRMRHHPKHEAGQIGDAGSEGYRTIGIGFSGVTQGRMCTYRLIIRDVPTLAVCDRALNRLLDVRRPHGASRFRRFKGYPPADKRPLRIMSQRTG